MSSSTVVEIKESTLAHARKKLESSLEKLQAINSAFPATREFLEIKGLESVAELDREGMRELQDFLQRIYRKMVH